MAEVSTLKMLNEMDRTVRKSVRKWLRFPHNALRLPFFMHQLSMVGWATAHSDTQVLGADYCMTTVTAYCGVCYRG
jgi:hypothetical protein